MDVSTTATKPMRMITVDKMHLELGYGWAKPATLRNLIFKADQNGLRDSGAIIKLGRRVLIDLDCFDAWLANHRQK